MNFHPLATFLLAALLLLGVLWRARRAAGAGAPLHGPAASAPLDTRVHVQPERRVHQDLRPLLLAMGHTYDTTLRDRGIRLDLRLGGDALPVRIRRHDMQQLLAHVVQLACRAMRAGGVLRVTAAREGAQVVVTWLDQPARGTGTAARSLVRLFEDGCCAPFGAGARDADPLRADAGTSARACIRLAHGNHGRMYPATCAGGALGLTLRLPLQPESALAAAGAAA